MTFGPGPATGYAIKKMSLKEIDSHRMVPGSDLQTGRSDLVRATRRGLVLVGLIAIVGVIWLTLGHHWFAKRPGNASRVRCALTQAIGSRVSEATEEMCRGLAEYRAHQQEDALEHFERAAQLDDQLVAAHIYLAQIYSERYEADKAKFERSAALGLHQYKLALSEDLRNTTCLKGIAGLYLAMNNLNEAEEYYREATSIDPNDAEAYYGLGIVDWNKSYYLRMEGRSELGIKPGDALPKGKVCNTLRVRNSESIHTGMDFLKEALKLRPTNSDAMLYLSFLYRERAELECDNPMKRAEFAQTADEWAAEARAHDSTLGKRGEGVPAGWE